MSQELASERARLRKGSRLVEDLQSDNVSEFLDPDVDNKTEVNSWRCRLTFCLSANKLRRGSANSVASADGYRYTVTSQHQGKFRKNEELGN